MKSKKKLKIAAVVIFVIIAINSILYLTNQPVEDVLKTVEHDVNLPSIKLNNYNFHSEVYGESNREVIIVLHGGPGDDYRSILPLKKLSDRYKVVFFDQRGTGLSQRVGKNDISMATYLEDINSFVNYYGEGDRVSIIGHSWGAMLGAYYVSNYPEKVDKLVLAEPGFLTPEMATEFMKKTNGFMPKKITLKLIMGMIGIYFESKHIKGPDKQARSDYFKDRFTYGLEFEGHPVAGYFRDGDLSNGSLDNWRVGSLVPNILFKEGMDENKNFVFNFIDGIEKYNNEVLFLTSEYNTIIGIEHQIKQMKYFSKAYMEVVKGTGHTMIGEDPKASISFIRTYLEKWFIFSFRVDPGQNRDATTYFYEIDRSFLLCEILLALESISNPFLQQREIHDESI